MLSRPAPISVDQVSFMITWNKHATRTLSQMMSQLTSMKIVLLLGLEGAGKQTTFKKLKSMSIHKKTAFEIELDDFVKVRGIMLSRNVMLVSWNQLPSKFYPYYQSDFIADFWRSCCRNMVAVIYVIDSRSYLGDHSCLQLQNMISSQTCTSFNDAAVLIMANKQDDPTAMTFREMHSGSGIVIWSLFSPQWLQSLRHRTFLDLLPDPLIEIVSEYCALKRWICSPKHMNSRYDQSVCCGPGKKYHIAGVSAKTGMGIRNGMEWIRECLKEDTSSGRPSFSSISSWFRPSLCRPSICSQVSSVDTEVGNCCLCSIQ